MPTLQFMYTKLNGNLKQAKNEKRTLSKKNFHDKNTDKKNIRYLALIHKKCQPMQITIAKKSLVKE